MFLEEVQASRDVRLDVHVVAASKGGCWTETATYRSCSSQNYIFVWYPAKFGDVAKFAAGKDQLPAAIFGFTAQQRMVRKQLETSPDAERPFTRELRIVFREKIKKPLEIRERSMVAWRRNPAMT